MGRRPVALLFLLVVTAGCLSPSGPAARAEDPLVGSEDHHAACVEVRERPDRCLERSVARHNLTVTWNLGGVMVGNPAVVSQWYKADFAYSNGTADLRTVRLNASWSDPFRWHYRLTVALRPDADTPFPAARVEGPSPLQLEWPASGLEGLSKGAVAVSGSTHDRPVDVGMDVRVRIRVELLYEVERAKPTNGTLPAATSRPDARG